MPRLTIPRSMIERFIASHEISEEDRAILRWRLGHMVGIGEEESFFIEDASGVLCEGFPDLQQVVLETDWVAFTASQAPLRLTTAASLAEG
ncbi:MAG: hypothetical protein V1907_02870 [Candidatus Kerfeldbacteria bacterium]